MNPLIDKTYFDNDRALKVTGQEGLQLDAAIADYQPAYLKGVLGPSLYDLFVSGLANGNRAYFSARFNDRFLKSPIDERWLWIRDGLTLTIANGSTYRWEGLVAATGQPKYSALADYIYWKYRANTATSTTGVGEVELQGENSTRTNPRRKMADVWNKMVEQNRILYFMLTELYDGEYAVYPEFQRQYLDSNLFERQNIFGI